MRKAVTCASGAGTEEPKFHFRNVASNVSNRVSLCCCYPLLLLPVGAVCTPYFCHLKGSAPFPRILAAANRSYSKPPSPQLTEFDTYIADKTYPPYRGMGLRLIMSSNKNKLPGDSGSSRVDRSDFSFARPVSSRFVQLSPINRTGISLMGDSDSFGSVTSKICSLQIALAPSSLTGTGSLIVLASPPGNPASRSS